MPRFYFDITEGGVSFTDKEGVLVGKLEDAEREAAATLAELVAAVVPLANPHNIQVVIRDEEQAPVARVTLTLARDRLV